MKIKFINAAKETVTVGTMIPITKHDLKLLLKRYAVVWIEL